MFRASVCELICESLKDKDHPLAQVLMEQEVLAHENDDDSYVDDNLVLCAHILFKLGRVEDSLIIWRAKGINYDTQTGISTELIAGAGIDETLKYLRSVNSSYALAALEDFHKFAEPGEFEEFRQYNEEYFG